MSLQEYLSSEGRPHYNLDWDCSNPRYVDWRITPPTFINYNVKVIQKYDVKEIYDYVMQLCNNRDERFRNELINLTLDILRANVNISVATAVERAFNELNVVYGGSASELVEGVDDS